MITIDKINAMIIERVRTVYPNIPFTAQEKLEEIERPAFKLIIDELQSEKFAGNMVRRTFPVELVYFAKDKLRPKLECFDVYEKVEPALYTQTSSKPGLYRRTAFSRSILMSLRSMRSL